MTSELKKSLVQRVLMQRSENNEDAFQRVLNVMNPVKLETQAIIAVGSSAHDVEMMKSADFAIYLDPDTSNFNFKEWRFLFDKGQSLLMYISLLCTI